MPRHAAPDVNSKAESSYQTFEGHEAITGHRHDTTLYDAIAGRVNAEGFIPTHQSTSKYRDTTSHSTKPIPPERALFRLKGRDFEGENDPYWAHRSLTADQQLPDSDLLKAVHAYASDFYIRTLGEGAMVDYRSMDETALLCCGILLEEMTDEVLGETGDLALTEGGILVPEVRTSGIKNTQGNSNKCTMDAMVAVEPTAAMAQRERVPPLPRKIKKRKTKHHVSDV